MQQNNFGRNLYLQRREFKVHGCQSGDQIFEISFNILAKQMRE